MSWWTRATTEERLAQIDGGISLGMTMRQIAMNCGADRGTVAAYGNRYGRRFTATSAASAQSGQGARSQSAQISFKRRRGLMNDSLPGAYSIFSRHDDEEPFMDEVLA